MKRIVIWSPNYAPELTGIPPLVTDAAEWLAGRGHEVAVVTAMPNYPERRIAPAYRGALWRSERLGDVAVHRSWLRVRPEERFRDKALYELTFAAFSGPTALRLLPGADVVVCVIPSLAAAACAAGLTSCARRFGRRVPLVLWVQDLVLNAALAVDGVGSRAARLLAAARTVEGLAVRTADRIVVCSPGFREYLCARGADPARIVTVLNWVDPRWIAPGAPRVNGDRTRFLYAGNLGYTQGLETLVEAARLAGPRIEVAIVGDGNAAPRVRRLAARAANVSVARPVPSAQFPQLLQAADAHVVVQRRVGAGANLPSKIATYLASGRPIVASLALETPAADLLRESGGAVLVPPEAPADLAEAMWRLHADPTLRRRLGNQGREFAVSNLGREGALARLEEAIVA